MAKNKQSTTFADLIADSPPTQDVVDLGSHSVLIQELSGRDRFELGTKEDDPRWEVMLWMCMKTMIDPKPVSEDELEKINPKWVVKIATAAMKLSGIDMDDEEEAGNESADGNESGGI